jgi:hypothetical protein
MARMVEIYALLQRDLEQTTTLQVSPEDRVRLTHAIETIERNMKALLAGLVAYREENAAQAMPTDDVGQILSTVLRWVQEHEA